MLVCFMIHFSMWSDSIHDVVDQHDIYFRLGGRVNSIVAQILLSEQERELHVHRDFKELPRLMDAPQSGMFPKERHAPNSMMVLQALVCLVPTVIRSWVERDTSGRREIHPSSRFGVLASGNMEP